LPQHKSPDQLLHPQVGELDSGSAGMTNPRHKGM
jgi:hypothetical protein